MDVYSLNIKDNKWLYLYYLLLHIICLSWTNTSLVAPSTVLRLMITTAIFLPLIKYIWLAPAVIILFVGLRFNSVAPFGYIPQSWNIFICLIIIITIIHSLLYNKKYYKLSNKQLSLFFFLVIVELLNFNFISPIYGFVIMLFFLYNVINNKLAFNLTMFSFVILTITLSVYYFVFAEEFVKSYFGSDAERSSWLDPNYFGVVLGSGVIISGFYLLNTIKISLLYKFIFIICIILGFIVIVLQASRGAILAVVGPLIVHLFLSKVSFKYKSLVSILFLMGIIYLFQEEYFTLLMDRTLNDDSSGSGRGDIWAMKINDWSSSFFNYWGSGYYASVEKFRPYDLDCHNEFVSILLNYGIIGFITLLYSMYKLLIKKNNRGFIWSFVLFIMVAFLSLSPITCQTGWTAIPFIILLLYKFIELEKDSRVYINNNNL